MALLDMRLDTVRLLSTQCCRARCRSPKPLAARLSPRFCQRATRRVGKAKRAHRTSHGGHGALAVRLCPPYVPRRGRRAERRKPMVSVAPYGVTAGASRRASGGVCAMPGRAFRFSRRPVKSASVVSQLLAGTRSGPGGSPDAARVFGCEPNPRAPRPVPLRQRLAKAPFIGRGGWMIGEVWEAGIRRG